MLPRSQRAPLPDALDVGALQVPPGYTALVVTASALPLPRSALDAVDPHEPIALLVPDSALLQHDHGGMSAASADLIRDVRALMAPRGSGGSGSSSAAPGGGGR